MFDFPSDFDVNAFPAGKPVVVSRFMGTAFLIVCLLTLFLSGLIIYVNHQQQIHPFLVSDDFVTGRWDVIGHSHEETNNNVVQISSEQVIKESVLVKFAKNWFRISYNQQDNQNTWAMCAPREDMCKNTNVFNVDFKCALYCNSGDDLFAKFTNDVLPDYVERFQNGEAWHLDNVFLKPMDKNFNKWIVRGTVIPSIGEEFLIMAYAIFDTKPENKYIITDFNAYRLWNIK
ncbi:MAG: hypothetical protein ACLRFI_04065 [Alphaproteobacteria bacterium]